MSTSLSRTLPTDQLRRLQFLLGESTGIETLYPPDAAPVTFRAYVSGSWESCERFFKIEFFGDIPGFGAESFSTLITYSEQKHCYRMWIFASSQEDPVHLTGNFAENRLVFVSEPTNMVWGMQRLRFTFAQLITGVELLGERWEPDGYAKYCSVVFRPE